MDEQLLELAWAAGFFDGEGSTHYTLTDGGKYHRIGVSISQKDRRVLERFKSAVSGGNIYGPHKGSLNHYSVVTVPQVLGVLYAIWPYLGEVKREQALEALRRYVDNREGSTARVVRR